MFVRILPEFDIVSRIDDGLNLGKMIGQVMKGRLGVNHRVENASERPDVGFGADLDPRFPLLLILLRRGLRVENGFRRHVIQSSDLRVSGDRGFIRLNRVGDPEVYQLQSSIDEQEIGWFENPYLQRTVKNYQIANNTWYMISIVIELSNCTMKLVFNVVVKV